MPLAQAELIKPLRKLRKLLKRNDDEISPAETHDMRTNCRRLEAMLCAVNVAENDDGKSLLKGIPTVRRAAGQVRDMDVLTSLARHPRSSLSMLRGLTRQHSLHTVAQEIWMIIASSRSVMWLSSARE
jgi:CHAD domain-containing protein